MSRSLRAFAAAVENASVRAVSVDVFDTLLLRTSTPEIVKFHHIAAAQARAVSASGGAPVSAAELLHLRVLAAEVAYRHVPLVHGAREPGIELILRIIVDHLVSSGRVPAEQRDHLQAEFLTVELEQETADLSPNRPLVRTLLAARSRGLPVVAISDMYLRRDHVRHLVDVAGAGDAITDVYVSSEFGYGKASGALFGEVCRRMGIRTGELAHIGDNRHADFRMAQAQGIQAFHVPRSLPWRGAREVRRRVFVRRLRSDRRGA